MAGQEREGRGLEMAEKVYPYQTAGKWVIPMVLVCIILIALFALLNIYAVQIAEWLYDVALKSTVNNFRAFGLGMSIWCSVILVAFLAWIIGGYPVKEIALSKEGIVLRRGRNPMTIQRVTEIKESRGGRILRLTGFTAEGKRIARRFSVGEMGKKRWNEFKEDLKKWAG